MNADLGRINANRCVPAFLSPLGAGRGSRWGALPAAYLRLGPCM